MFALGEEPTLHRMRWGDVDGEMAKPSSWWFLCMGG